MKRKNQNPEEGKKVGTLVPGYTPELGSRIATAIDRAGGLRSAASSIGVSEDSLAQWRDGKARPSFFGISKLSQLASVSVDWIATGKDSPSTWSPERMEGTTPNEQDKKLIGRLTDKIIRTYKELGMGIAWHEAAEMAVDEHNRIVASVADPVDRLVCVGEFAAELRQRLLANPADTDNDKRQA
jgi:hypothetical protein